MNNHRFILSRKNSAAQTLRRVLGASIGMFWGIGLALLLPHVTHAAALRIVVDRSSVAIHEPMRVDVAFDAQGQSANAIQGKILFPADLFQLEKIDTGASPITFWVESPKESPSGTVAFSGIMPGGFAGNAPSIISLILKSLKAGVGNISIQNGSVLANDGEGSSLALSVQSQEMSISSVVSSSTSPLLARSNIVPETFTPIIAQDPNLYGGNYFLVFSTTDKGSGIDHYEVAEIPHGSAIQSSTAWHIAVSPYLLQDQNLSSDIYVRAIDHDGNEITVLTPKTPRIVSWEIILGIAIALLLVLVVVRLRRKRNR